MNTIWPQISRREWTLVLLLALFTTAVTALPYWLGHSLAPPGQVYMHLLMNPEDALTYWAKMQQGFDGAWLYTITFTPEPHAAAGVGLFYVWLGQLARLTGTSLIAAWHVARLGAAFSLYLIIFYFAAFFLPDKMSRWTATILAIFGSGLGWLLFLGGQTSWLGAFPIDFKQPGAHTLFTSLTFPHIIVGTGIILFDVLVLKLVLDGALADSTGTTPSPRTMWLLAVCAGLANVLLGIAYPFLIYIVALTAVFSALYWLLKQRRIMWTAIGQTAVLFLIPAPLYLYYLSVWQTNDIFRSWDAQAGTPSPPWPHYLVGFGLLLLLALVLWWRRPSRRAHFAILWCWLLAVVMLVYAPLGPQRRFVQGIHIALSTLAAAGLVDVILPWAQQTRVWQRIVLSPRYSTPKLTRFMIILFLLFMCLSNLLLLADVSRVAGLTQPDLFFRPEAEREAAQWVQAQSTDPTILGAYQTGNYVAATSGSQVMLGHWAETVSFADKLDEVDRFFSEGTDDAWRQELLARYDIEMVWFGPREQALGAFDPSRAVYLEPVFSNDTITLYAARP